MPGEEPIRKNAGQSAHSFSHEIVQQDDANGDNFPELTTSFPRKGVVRVVDSENTVTLERQGWQMEMRVRTDNKGDNVCTVVHRKNFEEISYTDGSIKNHAKATTRSHVQPSGSPLDSIFDAMERTTDEDKRANILVGAIPKALQATDDCTRPQAPAISTHSSALFGYLMRQSLTATLPPLIQNTPQ